MSTRMQVIVTLALVAGAGACKSEGSFPAVVSEPQPASGEAGSTSQTGSEPAGEGMAAPDVKHERVEFAWQSTDGGQSGEIQTTLPGGEQFTGRFHAIRSTTVAGDIDGFYGTWYGGPWVGPSWTWGGAWPYYDDPDAYITYYSGKVVAQLSSDRGSLMRCRFDLDDPVAGMEGGGAGECQVSTGERITAVFAAQ